MNTCNYSIWIEAEEWENGWDINNDNTDVIVIDRFSCERIIFSICYV